jgi:hypothetical protein
MDKNASDYQHCVVKEEMKKNILQSLSFKIEYYPICSLLPYPLHYEY